MYEVLKIVGANWIRVAWENREIIEDVFIKKQVGMVEKDDSKFFMVSKKNPVIY